MRLPVNEVRDPQNPQVILQHRIPSGIHALCDKLRETFGQNDQEMASTSLESFFELRRGRLSLQEYAVEFDLRIEEAHDRAGLEMNEIALFCFFFKKSGLSSRFVEDWKFCVHGDLRRYSEARSLALRLSTKVEGESFYQDDATLAAPSVDNRSWDYWGEEWNEENEDAWSSWYGEEDNGDAMEVHEGDWPENDEYAEEQVADGGSHVLWSHRAKAKRVSYNTSNAETLAAIGGLETVSLVTIRLSTELYHPIGQPTLKDLTEIQENGNTMLPVDCPTDCRDFYELTTGERSLPQDKDQRLYILAHKEARFCGRIRWMVLVPTQSTTAEALTKPIIAPTLLFLMSCGMVQFKNEEGHPLLFRRLAVLHDYDEDTILKMDENLIKNFVMFMPVASQKAPRAMLVTSLVMTQIVASQATRLSLPTRHRHLLVPHCGDHHPNAETVDP